MTARIYVGTYAKYSSGSIAGKWLDLDDYTDKESFLEACKELHKDEQDPEFMFQDYEGFPKAYYSESYIPDGLFDWLELDDDDRELLAVYQEGIDDSGDVEQAREAFMGRGYNSEADWAAEWLEETGGLEDVPDRLKNYIDFAAYARDASYSGDVSFIRYNGDLWVFCNH